jgi:hypothetical protein
MEPARRTDDLAFQVQSAEPFTLRSVMPNRRTFLVSTSATSALSRSAAGANGRLRFALIGAGSRGSYMGGVFASAAGCECAVCDVFKPNREQ